MGDNLPGSPVNNLSAQQCKEKCSNDPRCFYYSYSYPLMRCFTKFGKGNPTPLPGFFSATKNCAVLPPMSGNGGDKKRKH